MEEQREKRLRRFSLCSLKEEAGFAPDPFQPHNQLTTNQKFNLKLFANYFLNLRVTSSQLITFQNAVI
jgi:hypothetical protein